MKDVNEVIKENEKLITYVIKKFFPKELGDEDIYQIGRIALWESIIKYNENKGAKFNTFAIACIKLKIARELQKRSYKIRAEDNNLIYENENFEDAASTLFGLISNAQQKFPDYERILYLDIDGHKR